MKGWSLATCLCGWLLLAISFAMTRLFKTDQWSVVIPLTVHLMAYLVLGAGLVLSVLWALWLGRWQEDMAVAGVNALLAAGPLVWLFWSYSQQSRTFTQFVLFLMWTGN